MGVCMKKFIFSLFILLSLVASLRAQEGWKKKNLFPANSYLSDIDMHNNFVIAVGEMGVVKYSIDYGNSWDIREVGTSKNLSSVCIYDDNNAIAASFEGGIYKTNDAASTWSEMNIFTDEELSSINYFGKEYGIMTGKNGFIAESYGNFEKWTKVDVDIETNTLNSLIFDKDNAIIYGEKGTLLYKSDGADWEQVDLHSDADFAGIVQVDDTSAFILSENYVGFISRDKGKSWKNVGILPATFSDKIKVSFMENSIKGIRLRVYSEKYHASQDYFSHNGEEWWEVSRSEGYIEYHINDLVFDRSKGSGFAITYYGLIYNATNHLIDQYTFEKNKNLTEINNVYLEGLRILDGANYSIYNKGYNGLVFTSNAGKIWKSSKFEMPTPKGEYRNIDAHMPDQNILYIVSNDVWHVKEGSHTTTYSEGYFVKVDENGNKLNFHKFENGGGIYSMDFVNKDCGLAHTMTVCHVTRDGGITWDMIVRPVYDICVNEMYMPKPGVIVSLEWIYADKKNQIAISEDYGKTWKERTCPYRLIKMFVYDESTILAHYEETIAANIIKYHIVITRDGGKTWKELNISNFEYPESSKFYVCYKIYDDKIIVVTSEVGGIIYTSEDFGETWETKKCYLGDKSRIIDIAIVDNEPILVFYKQVILVSDKISDVEDISDLSEAPFSIYPNPADKILNIETNDNTEYDKVKIYSIDGKLLLEGDYLTGMSINIEDLQSGNYYLVLTDKEGKQLGQKLNIVR